MKKNIVLLMLGIYSTSFPSDLSTIIGTNTGIFAKEKEDKDSLIYIADNFHEMATLPGLTLGAPTGLVPSYGVLFTGLSGRKDRDKIDGALALGMGFGNSDTIGGAISLGVGSIDPRDGGSFDRGDLEISVGHDFKEYGIGWSAGVMGIDLWHAKGIDGRKQKPSFYTAITKLWANDYVPMAITGGFGNNSFANINTENNRENKIDGFGALSFYLMPQLSLIVDYTSNILTSGFSLVPFPDYPISLNLGATNLNEQGPENKVAVIGSIGAAYIF